MQSLLFDVVFNTHSYTQAQKHKLNYACIINKQGIYLLDEIKPYLH